MYRRNLNHFPV
jgi:hypothetical protein